jgi:hypothetical protein
VRSCHGHAAAVQHACRCCSLALCHVARACLDCHSTPAAAVPPPLPAAACCCCCCADSCIFCSSTDSTVISWRTFCCCTCAHAVERYGDVLDPSAALEQYHHDESGTGINNRLAEHSGGLSRTEVVLLLWALLVGRLTLEISCRLSAIIVTLRLQ